ncbi:MAG: mandelate racemase/muconate lactonizing enzyme family protein [Spirochaetaceae bacterium]|nr:MAG: mandelate racemase/muconate lactonizing enzyme family protein [Spirochaetaceae bacterium]
MKVTAVRTTPIRVPIAVAPYSTEGAGTKREWYRLGRITAERPEPAVEYVIVTIETDEGVVGVGESVTDIGFFGEPIEQVRSLIEFHFGPRLLGADPFDREKLLHSIEFRGNSCAKAGIDLALHDLIGKALGIPVYKLLGGQVRSRVPVSIEVAGGPPDAMAESCLASMKQGVRAFKAKIGGIPDDDVERIAAMRAAVGPGVSIRTDANQGYSVKEAIRFCRLAESRGLGVDLLEQPVAAWDIAGMAHVRASVDTLIEADEAAYSVHDVMNIIRQSAADVINIKIGKAGGLYAAKKIAALAEAAGLKCVLGTAFGLGPEVAAKLHLAASTVGVTDAVEFTEILLHGNPLASPGHEALSVPLDADGCLPVPVGPGLGVELDPARIDELTIR